MWYHSLCFPPELCCFSDTSHPGLFRNGIQAANDKGRENDFKAREADVCFVLQLSQLFSLLGADDFIKSSDRLVLAPEVDVAYIWLFLVFLSFINNIRLFIVENSGKSILGSYFVGLFLDDFYSAGVRIPLGDVGELREEPPDSVDVFPDSNFEVEFHHCFTITIPFRVTSIKAH